jgi:hypothetical protein
MKKKAWLDVVARAGVIALALVWNGCDSKKEVSEDEFCNTVAKRECVAVVLPCQKTDVAPCMTVRVTECKKFAADAKGGKRAFHPEGADACFNAVSQTYAKTLIKTEDFESLDRTCSQVFAGTAKANDACAADLDCQPGLICDRNFCAARRAISAGGNCGNPGEICPDTEYCRQGAALFTCVKRPEKGAACSALEPCLPTMRCEAGICVEKLPNDATCQSHEQCQSGYCDPYPLANMPSTCALGLSFARFSPSCDAYFGVMH